MPPEFQLSRSKQAKALYRRLQRRQPSFVGGVASIVDLAPLLGLSQRKQVSSSGIRSDLAALCADRKRALSQLLHG